MAGKRCNRTSKISCIDDNENKYLRPSKWISGVKLKGCVYYVIWNQLVFSKAKSIFYEKATTR